MKSKIRQRKLAAIMANFIGSALMLHCKYSASKLICIDDYFEGNQDRRYVTLL